MDVEMPEVNLSLGVDDRHIGQIDDIAAACEKAGMRIDKKLSLIGVITGSIEADKVPLLRGITGVADVEVQRQYQIPPPDSDIQ